MLEQLRAQRAEATNGELQEENERLRDELESHIARVSELEAKVQEVDDDREQLRKANEKLRLDLEAITEKGQVRFPTPKANLGPCIPGCEQVLW
jgi:peptidoglycan hydrolase CwlO-like protein